MLICEECRFAASEDKWGGAIGATVTMTNCTLTGNQAKENGGAVCAKEDTGTLSTVTITGGTIGEADTDGNTVTSEYGFGGDVYVKDGMFTMKGSTKIAENNDIYLKNGKKTTIDGSLTGSVTIRVGRITPETYMPGIQVLEAVGGTNLVDEVRKFTVTPEPNGQQWGINNLGNLRKM